MAFRPIMKILYGPPGTGKTWLAAREAVGAVEPEQFLAWRRGEITDEAIMQRHHDLVLEGRIKWVTFHPSYSYEDFVESFRPVRGSGGETISFDVREGPFREICEVGQTGRSTSFGPPVGSVIPAIGGGKTYEVIGANSYGWLLRVRPDRVDEVSEYQEKFVTRRLIERAAELELDPKVFSIPGKTQVKPSDYGIEGDEPVVGAKLRRRAAALLGVSSTDLANSSHAGALAAYVKGQQAAEPEAALVCLVIDEINRADLSRVFGELITLLEPDKRIGAKEERRVHLPYSGEQNFGVPPTVSVIGTMNSADRSIASMDFAMRRRFSFQEVVPEASLCPTDYGGVDIARTLRGINNRVGVLRGRNLALGHAILMAEALEDVRTAYAWGDDNDGRMRALAYIFRTRIVPLLEEYFHDDISKVEVALGVRGKRFGPDAVSFMKIQEIGAGDRDMFEDMFDTDAFREGSPAEWWDPKNDAFNAGAFREAVAMME